MKNIPNYLTFSRIIISVILLSFFHKITPAFLVLFVVAMLTDLLDGKIARKLRVCSQSGAFLDSIADFLLDANLIKIVFTTNSMTKKLTFWMVSVLCVGAISPIINFIKHKKIFFIHSIPCKLCMWALFLIPFAIQFDFINGYLIFTLSLITFAMIELIMISLLLKIPDPNAKSLYSVIKQNRAQAA